MYGFEQITRKFSDIAFYQSKNLNLFLACTETNYSNNRKLARYRRQNKHTEHSHKTLLSEKEPKTMCMDSMKILHFFINNFF